MEKPLSPSAAVENTISTRGKDSHHKEHNTVSTAPSPPTPETPLPEFSAPTMSQTCRNPKETLPGKQSLGTDPDLVSTHNVHVQRQKDTPIPFCLAQFFYRCKNCAPVLNHGCGQRIKSLLTEVASLASTPGKSKASLPRSHSPGPGHGKA